MKNPFIKSEQEAAALLVDYLESIGLDVYQEVQLGDAVADIVALRGREVWIIEVKMTWSLDLMEQLREHHRRCHGHRIFAAVPQSRNDYTRQRLFKDLGFGSITIRNGPEDWSPKTAMALMAPRVTSAALPGIISQLDEGHKTHAKAGAPCAAGRYTPFRKTIEALKKVVDAEPGLTIKQALSRMEHHYSTDAGARISLLSWAQAGKVPGVHVVSDKKRLTLWPEGMDPSPGETPPLPYWAQPQLQTGA